MKISSELNNLPIGTIVYRCSGDIVIDSEYDAKTDSYIYRKLELASDGVLEFGRIHPFELIGSEIY